MKHDMGHTEKRTLRAPRDDSGKKNFIQSMGSTISYLERYTLLAVTGLATHDMDDDGNAAGGQDEFITEEQVKAFTARITAIYGDDPSMFITWLESAIQVVAISDIPAGKYGMVDKVIKSLEKKAEIDKKRMGREPGQEG